MLECVQSRAQGGTGGIGGPLDPNPQHRAGKVLDCGQLRGYTQTKGAEVRRTSTEARLVER